MGAADQILGSKYRLIERIGAGGMGEVWVAHQIDLDREVAVKLLAIQNDDVALKRFEREARLAAQLQSPHVARAFDYGTHDGRPYLVMERLVGEDLHARIARGPLSLSAVFTLVEGAAEALGEAHQRGIIHRDIKPANLFFARAGERETVKVLDFGIATRNSASVPLTTAGTIIGTPQYMSPEQSQGDPVDHRSDLWSLAVVAYEALTGENPFAGKTDWESLAAIVRRPIAPPSHRVPDLSDTVDAFFHRALRRDPNARYATAALMASAFAAAVRGEIVEPVDGAADTKPMELPEGVPLPTRAAPSTDVVAVRSRETTSPAPRRLAPWLVAVVASAVAAWLGLGRVDALRADPGLSIGAARVQAAALSRLASPTLEPPLKTAPAPETPDVVPTSSASAAPRPRPTRAPARPKDRPPTPAPANEFGI